MSNFPFFLNNSMKENFDLNVKISNELLSFLQFKISNEMYSELYIKLYTEIVSKNCSQFNSRLSSNFNFIKLE